MHGGHTVFILAYAAPGKIQLRIGRLITAGIKQKVVKKKRVANAEILSRLGHLRRTDFHGKPCKHVVTRFRISLKQGELSVVLALIIPDNAVFLNGIRLCARILRTLLIPVVCLFAALNEFRIVHGDIRQEFSRLLIKHQSSRTIKSSFRNAGEVT
ncbi:hypothetical protein SDC9_210798 [bioreactor metagenome]|uniref:Uncharacterized protein n=1 Tax=bioreactor metagenome TaxID=1076179 RepID=A0A645JSI6_9ZZZZ